MAAPPTERIVGPGRRPSLAALAVALAAGVWAAGAAPLPWLVALLAAFAWLARSRRWLRWMVIALALGGALALRESATLEGDRASLAPLLDDGIEDTLTGTVRGPVARTRRGERFVLELDPASDGTSPRVEVALFSDAETETDGAGALQVHPGDRLRLRGLLRSPRGYRVPGAPDAERRAAARGVVAHLGAAAARAERLAPGSRTSPWHIAGRAQRRLADRIDRAAGGEPGAAVLCALVTGDRGAMTEADAAPFRATGAAHVLAVSGLHLAAVSLLVFGLVRRAWALLPALALRLEPARAAALAAAPFAIGYALATGASPSAVRALWVVLVFLAGVLLDRRARFLDALGLAALVVLAHRPSAIHDISVQLSFAATASLALAIGRREPDGLELSRPRPRPAALRLLAAAAARLWSGARAAVAAALWTTAATAPVLAHHFGEVALAGPVANLVAVPAVELFALPAGLLGVLLGDVWPAAGDLLVRLAALVMGRVEGALGHIAGWIPPAPAASPDLAELALWSGGFAAGAVLVRGPRRLGRRALAALLACAVALAALWTWRADIAPRLRSDLVVTFLDVGQGDGALIELPGGGAVLIDAGGLPFVQDPDPASAARAAEAPGREAVLRTLVHRRIDRLDLVVLSHAHPDHVRGLAAVARAIPIEELWLPRPHPDRPLPADIAAIVHDLAARGTRVVHPPLGLARRQGGVSFTVLWPVAPAEPGDPRAPPHPADEIPAAALAAVDPIHTENDSSLVLRLDYAGRRLLFTGDLEEEGEELLLARHGAAALAADLVKVGHHGSSTSSTAPFVHATRPAHALISCGLQNRFGFPHPAVLARWHAAGARIHRTDLHGTITATVRADGRVSVSSIVPAGAAE